MSRLIILVTSGAIGKRTDEENEFYERYMSEIKKCNIKSANIDRLESLTHMLGRAEYKILNSCCGSEGVGREIKKYVTNKEYKTVIVLSNKDEFNHCNSNNGSHFVFCDGFVSDRIVEKIYNIRLNSIINLKSVEKVIVKMINNYNNEKDRSMFVKYNNLSNNWSFRIEKLPMKFMYEHIKNRIVDIEEENYEYMVKVIFILMANYEKFYGEPTNYNFVGCLEKEEFELLKKFIKLK